MLQLPAVIASAAVPDVPDDAWDERFDRAVAAGTLHPLEASFARSLPVARRATFLAGRQALREALAGLDGYGHRFDAPILRTPRGAPALPSGLTGSITHKRTQAKAAVALRTGSLQHLGIDLEHRPTEADLARPSIARKILTAREFAHVAQTGHDTLAGRELVLVHFALKEAVYKAIDPFVERYVRFTEVELELTQGQAAVSLLLPEPAVADVRVHAGWRIDGEWIEAWASSHL
ncbi:4'-phosphopantetheinyl transferase family protein [Gemmatimonas sp.]